jgi:hypothetical protein
VRKKEWVGRPDRQRWVGEERNIGEKEEKPAALDVAVDGEEGTGREARMLLAATEWWR